MVKFSDIEIQIAMKVEKKRLVRALSVETHRWSLIFATIRNFYDLKRSGERMRIVVR
jgi:hypothetical protein